MITATFYKKNGFYIGFIVKGHAGGVYGKDIICAAVSSAVMFASNTITDFLEVDAQVEVKNNAVGLRLNGFYYEDSDSFEYAAADIIESLERHLELLSNTSYNGSSIKVISKELSNG